jgi:hypothetical protein
MSTKSHLLSFVKAFLIASGLDIIFTKLLLPIMDTYPVLVLCC